MPKPRDRDRSQVLLDGVPVDNVTMEEAVAIVERHVDERKSLLVVTPNVDHLYHLRRDPEFRHAYDRAGLILADGASMLCLARAKGTPLKAKIPGVDFMVEYCRTAANRGRRVFFVGGVGDVAQRSMEVLQERFPGLIAAGTLSPSVGFENKQEETDRILEQVQNCHPDVLFVGAGTPKQEKWLLRHGRKLGPIVSVCVGASFDLVSGRIPRAPRWMQNLGFEWLWRLAHEPRRLFRRYVIEDFPFFLALLVKCLGCRLRGAGGRARNEGGPSTFKTGHNTTDSAGTD